MTVFRYKPEIYGIKNEIIWRPVADIYRTLIPGLTSP